MGDVSESTVRRLVRRGELITTKIGRRTLISRDSLRAFIEGLDLRPVKPSGPRSLPDYEPVTVPVLMEMFFECIAVAKTHGLTFPRNFSVAWRNAPIDRLEDGLTRLHPDGRVTAYLNSNMPAAECKRVCFHELQHVSDFMRYGARFANDERERRANAFVARVLAPDPLARELEQVRRQVAEKERREEIARLRERLQPAAPARPSHHRRGFL